jgi:hypothetical protein
LQNHFGMLRLQRGSDDLEAIAAPSDFDAEPRFDQTQMLVERAA